jgi:uncharacterized protein YecE (DUF72 family)
MNPSTSHAAAAFAAPQPIPTVRIGCAGWGIASVSAASFPSEGSHLERYARVFNTVEINSSFYRPHRPHTYERWAQSVPDDFRFSVKIPRTISHERRLRDVRAPMDDFLEQATMLREKLGCLLLQLPPSLALAPQAARDFFHMLRELTEVPVACEPRHASWFTDEAATLMREAGVACVRAHPVPVPDVEPRGHESILYIRLHGAPRIYYSAYDEAFIDAVAARIIEARAAGREVWCMFDNTAAGAAIPNALRLVSLSGP